MTKDNGLHEAIKYGISVEERDLGHRINSDILEKT